MKRTLWIGLPDCSGPFGRRLLSGHVCCAHGSHHGQHPAHLLLSRPLEHHGAAFPYVNFVASVVFLFSRRSNPLRAQAADALAVASAEMTLVFLTIGLATGMLWAKPVWGIWWTWDARLTSCLILWLIYASYLLLRRFTAGGETQTLAAVLSIFAAVDVPIVYMSIRWWRTQHPSPVFFGGPDSGIDPRMKPAFF